MNRNTPIYALIVLFCLTRCTAPKSGSAITWASLYEGDVIVAWNEDTVHNYQFALAKEKKFLYNIITNDSFMKDTLRYKGTYKLSNDTIFLNYAHGRQPLGVTNYLIKEASGNYLIQPFTESNKRMFLRIHWELTKKYSP